MKAPSMQTYISSHHSYISVILLERVVEGDHPTPVAQEVKVNQAVQRGWFVRVLMFLDDCEGKAFETRLRDVEIDSQAHG